MSKPKALFVYPQTLNALITVAQLSHDTRYECFFECTEQMRVTSIVDAAVINFVGFPLDQRIPDEIVRENVYASTSDQATCERFIGMMSHLGEYDGLLRLAAATEKGLARDTQNHDLIVAHFSKLGFFNNPLKFIEWDKKLYCGSYDLLVFTLRGWAIKCANCKRQTAHLSKCGLCDNHVCFKCGPVAIPFCEACSTTVKMGILGL